MGNLYSRSSSTYASCSGSLPTHAPNNSLSVPRNNAISEGNLPSSRSNSTSFGKSGSASLIGSNHSPKKKHKRNSNKPYGKESNQKKQIKCNKKLSFTNHSYSQRVDYLTKLRNLNKRKRQKRYKLNSIYIRKRRKRYNKQNESIENVKAKIQYKEQIPNQEQTLILA
eukprot:432957_1